MGPPSPFFENSEGMHKFACALQGLNQLQAYLVLHRYLEGEGVPLKGTPAAEQLQAAAVQHLQERSNLLTCIQAVLLYAQGKW